VLRTTGVYTQVPGSNPDAAQACELTTTSQPVPDPSLGETVFYLVSGNSAGVEVGLGTDSIGVPRPNLIPCIP